MEPDARRVRAAEVVGAVSLATDLGTGQPLEHTLRTAILAVRLGDLAGASPQELRDAYYVSLLHSFGCTSDAPEQPRRSCCARPRRSASAQAVDAVLAAAGHRVERRPRELPAGLTERELEVLPALVAGQTNQRIGESLGISAKTAGHHVQHIYEKAGVRSRAAATVWAFEHSLVHAAEGVRPMWAQVAAPETHPRHRRRAAAPGNKGGRPCSGHPAGEDYDRFVRIFSTTGAEKRKQHGSQGATVFRDPSQDDRVWVVFDWDAEGWQSFVADPEVPGIMHEAGHKGKPQAYQYGGRYEA